MSNMNQKEYITIVAFFHILVLLVVGLDIPILRQLIAFAYLSFMPGFVLISAFGIKNIRQLDLILCSLGLSLTFDMFIGLLLNQLLPFLGISQPLSAIPLLLTINAITLTIFAISCKRGISDFLNSISKDYSEQIQIAQVLLILSLPIISVVSAVYVNQAMPIVPIAITILFAASALSTKLISPKLYPLLIFSASLSLVLQFPLMTKHIVGADSPLEYYVYKLTAVDGYWTPSSVGSWPQPAYNSMLSITILPAVYSNLLNIDGELLFKILFPFIFSFVPVVVYRLLADGNRNLTALISAFFLISGRYVFYSIEPLGLNRQMVGALFLLLSVFLLIKKPFSTNTNRLLLVIFGAALSVSHYSLMLLYLLFLVLVFVFGKIGKKPESTIIGGISLALFDVTVAWYYFTPSGIVDKIYTTLNTIVSSFSLDFLNTSSRPSEVFTSPAVQSTASSINWFLFIAVHFLVLVGILSFILNKPNYKIDFKYRMLVLFAAMLLFMAVAVPHLSTTLNFVRYYGITFLFLAPCFVFGAKTLFRTLKWIAGKLFSQHKIGKRVTNIAVILLVILASSYFLSQYGIINHYGGGSPQSYTLDWNKLRTSEDVKVRMELYYCYTPEQDIASATWLSKLITNSSLIYSDFGSYHPLTIYGWISQNNLALLTNTTQLSSNSYLYLRYFNVIDGFINPTPTSMFNTTELSPTLNQNNLVYTNGESQVYAFSEP
jgi:uncharacterized membrane protein